MTTIRIISGNYGLHVSGRVVRKGKESEPFEVDDREAERLVSLGVAEIVSVKEEPEEEAVTPEEEAEIPEEEPDEDMASKSMKELREIAKEKGVKMKVGMSKDELVEALSDAPDLTAEALI